MELKFRISCTCHCQYTVNENLSTDKIICPNCGMEYPHSAKLIAILNTAKDIPEGEFLSDDFKTKVISSEEDMKSRQ